MSEWLENSNGNHVYVLDTDEVMTVFERAGEWYGVYDHRFTPDGFKTADQAMEIMERAVLDERLDLLTAPKPEPVGWKKTNTGGYQCIRHGVILTIKQAKNDKWYLIKGQAIVPGKWFDTAEQAKREGDQY